MLTAQSQVTGRESSREMGMRGTWGRGEVEFVQERVTGEEERAEERGPPRERQTDVTWQKTRQPVFAVLADNAQRLWSQILPCASNVAFTDPVLYESGKTHAHTHWNVNAHRSTLCCLNWEEEEEEGEDAAGVTIAPLTISCPDHPPKLVN